MLDETNDSDKNTSSCSEDADFLGFSSIEVPNMTPSVVGNDDNDQAANSEENRGHRSDDMSNTSMLLVVI